MDIHAPHKQRDRNKEHKNGRLQTKQRGTGAWRDSRDRETEREKKDTHKGTMTRRGL